MLVVEPKHPHYTHLPRGGVLSEIAWFHQLYLFCFRPGSGRVALTGDVRSESARYCLHQQERADTCQSDVKVLKKNLSAKAVIDHSTKEHA
jgi:hypothetical protein